MDTPPPPPPPPPPAHAGEPEVTAADPTADGYYCGSRRSQQQLAQAIEGGDPHPWPWCRLRSGKGSDHVGVGRCRVHGGNSPNGRTHARLRMAELVQPAIALLAQTMTNEGIPPSIRLRAAQDVLDRAGYPRRVEVDADDARTMLYDRLVALRGAEELDELDDEDDGSDA